MSTTYCMFCEREIHKGRIQALHRLKWWWHSKSVDHMVSRALHHNTLAPALRIDQEALERRRCGR